MGCSGSKKPAAVAPSPHAESPAQTAKELPDDHVVTAAAPPADEPASAVDASTPSAAEPPQQAETVQSASPPEAAAQDQAADANQLAPVVKHSESPRRRRRGQWGDRSGDIEAPKHLRTFTANFVRAISLSPLIGKRQATVQVDKDYGKRIADGLRLEAAREEAEGRNGNLVVRANVLPAWYTGDPATVDLAELFELCPQNELTRHVLWTYSVESFLYRIPNQVLREQDESRVGFVPFIRLLHDTLAHRWGGLTQYEEPVYRVMRMDDLVSKSYVPNPTEARANVFAWDGFTSCSCDASFAFENYESFKANTLVIITPDKGQGPVDVRSFSDWGEDEGEVIFTLGQQFQKKSVELRRRGDVWKELGVAAGSDLDGEMRVIRLSAVDAFYDFADDIFRDGANEQEAVQLLENRVEFEKERTGDPESVSVGVAMNYLGKAYRLLGRLPEALELLQKELEISRKHFGDEHAATATSYESVAAVLVTMGRHEEGISMHRKCMDLRIKLHGEDCADVAHCYNNISIGLLREGKYQESLEHNQKALAIRLKHIGEYHPDTALSYGNIAEAFRMMGKNDDALDNHKKALEIRKIVLDPRHPSVGDNLLNIALIYSSQKNRNQALQNFNEALSISLEHMGETHSSIGIIYNGMAYLEQNTAHHEEAVPLYAKARDIFTTALGPDHPHTKYAENGLRKCEEKVARKRQQAAAAAH